MQATIICNRLSSVNSYRETLQAISMSSKIFLGATCLLFLLAGFSCVGRGYGFKADKPDIQKGKLRSVAQNWRNLSGEHDWDGLLDPLDVELRKYIIHYGEMVQASMDSFIKVKSSKNIGLPRYAKKHFFGKVGLVKGKPYAYQVVRFLYASTKGNRPSSYPVPEDSVAGYSNYVGYIAVSTDLGSVALGRRDILITIRETSKDEELALKFELSFVNASDIFGTDHNPQLQEGRYVYYVASEPGSAFNNLSFRDQVLTTVRELVDKYQDEEVSITVGGFSMGGAFVTIIASDIAYNGYNKPTNKADTVFPVTGFAMGSSAVGDEGFVQVYNSIENLHILRIVNLKDPNPGFPGSETGYCHVGTELVVDSLQSPYLKNASLMWMLHNLEVYMHAIAGYQGSDEGFKFVVDRNIVLLNKYADALNDSFNILPSWWVEEKKNMIQMDNGTWVLALDREVDNYEPVSTFNSVSGSIGLYTI